MTATPAQAYPSQTGVGNIPGCLEGRVNPLSYLQQYPGSTWMRVSFSPFGSGDGNNGQALPCIKTAVGSGYHILISIQWEDAWTMPQVQGFFRQILSYYAPYATAVSVGNEQELWDGGGGRQLLLTSGQYAAAWQAVEPIIAQTAPHAVRVAGEISPWGESWLKRAIAIGLPGVQAVAAHPYVTAHSFDPAEFSTWAHRLGLQVWYTEGLSGPDAWGPDRPVTGMIGGDIAFAWLN